MRDSAELPGLYRVKKDNRGMWRVVDKENHVSTEFSAVNGMLNNLAKAQWLMGEHINFEPNSKSVHEFTLFHNPSVGASGDLWECARDKIGITTDVTKKFAKVLEESQKTEEGTTWLAHSQGGIIFSEAVRYLLNGSSRSLLNRLSLNGVRHAKKGKLLNKQKVVFHGNGNNNFRSKLLFRRAGVNVIAIRSHQYDVVNNLAGFNTISLRRQVGGLVYAPHVVDGSVVQSPHTLLQEYEK